jgi:outer membrane protein OmpA-like peptidoglycan-associated protein
MKREFWLIVLSLFVFSLGNEVFAEVKDHPVIKPIPGSTLDSHHSQYNNYNAYTFRYKENGKRVEKTVKGKYWKLDYEFLKKDGKRDESVSSLEMSENFKQAALERGGEVLGEDARNLIFSLISDGRKLWVHLQPGIWKGFYRLHIVEEKSFKKKLTFGAEEIKKQLDEKGHVAIYGILFDVDKASLKPESQKPLQEIVKLMRNYPDLKLEVQGHTDNQGAADYNRELSQRRAETVKTYLTTYGTDDSRLEAKGYGLSQPVASNDTEEGRAKNRRVELVKKEVLGSGPIKIKSSGDEQAPNVITSEFSALVDAAEMSYKKGSKIATVKNLKKALLSIWEEVPLTAGNIRLVLDTKDYTTKKNNVYRKGEPIYITAQIFGYQLKKVGDSYHINITTDFLVLDDAGKILGGQQEVLKFDDISPIPITDFSLDLTYTLTGAPAGIYKFQTTVNDKNSAKSTKFDTKIEIK